MAFSTRQLQETGDYLRDKFGMEPEIGLILGSGLGVLAELIENPFIIPYHDIPHFPVSTVSGHAGELVAGEIRGRRVLAMKGRFHYYEGYDMGTVTFPVRVMRELNVRSLVVTNAAGGINTVYQPGDLMLITDHLNLTFNHPLIGANNPLWGERFPDMSDAYNTRLRQATLSVAAKQGVKIREGVYAGLTGPTYETPAEVRMLRKLGADAVGMSTVPEVIVARHSGMEVLGISCITNMAAGILPHPLSHEDVMETAEMAKTKFLNLVLGVIGII